MDKLTQSILGRKHSFLNAELIAHKEEIQEKASGANFLIIGAAGSIGSAFVRELVRYRPNGLHLVDISENLLVELVRDLRSSEIKLPTDFTTYSLDFGQCEMEALLKSRRFDYVLNFSALKHVRSERDAFTLMRLLEVNVLANRRLIDWVFENQNVNKIFSVSSDKAVRPGNMMGASKAFMERIFQANADRVDFSSARFANVAFSDGSLLHSFQNRLQKGQPLSAPSDVRRFFISAQEAGQLCVLSCFVCQNREVVYPLFEPETDMMTFSEIARAFLAEQGMKAFECESEKEAKEMAANLDVNSKEWPCCFTLSDTSGEKSFEEFVDPREKCDLTRFTNVGVITDPILTSLDSLQNAEIQIEKLKKKRRWTLEDLKAVVQEVVPELAHISGMKNLDQKM